MRMRTDSTQWNQHTTFVDSCAHVYCFCFLFLFFAAHWSLLLYLTRVCVCALVCVRLLYIMCENLFKEEQKKEVEME